MSLAIGIGVAMASFLPTSFDGPSDTGYRQFGEMIAEEVGEGDLVVAPYIMDSSLGYYTDGLLEERVREVVLKGRLQRLLVAARSGAGPRYSLADYMLTTNFTTAEAGHTDRYRNYELPAGAFQAVRQTGNLRLFESLHPPEIVVDGSEHLATDAWRVYYESHPNTTKISTGLDDGSRELRLSTVDKATFVLHSTFRFDPGADGLLLLAYTKSGAEGAYASLYQAGSATATACSWSGAASSHRRNTASITASPGTSELTGTSAMPVRNWDMTRKTTPSVWCEGLLLLTVELSALPPILRV